MILIRHGLLACAWVACCFLWQVARAQEPQDADADALEAVARQFRRMRQDAAEEANQVKLESRAAEQHAGAASQPYLLDTELQEAWDYFSDHENRRREVAIELFQNYIDENPDTIFRPEILGRIGQLYSSHRNAKFGETYEPDQMERYYQMAVDAYGSRYSDESRTMRASIANRNTKTLEDRLEYYEWLCRFAESTDPDDIYDVVAIEIAAQGNRASPYWSLEEREKQLASLHSNLPKLMLVAQKNIFASSSLSELQRVIELFPETELARQSRARLERFHESLAEQLERSLDTVPLEPASQSDAETDGTSDKEGGPADDAGRAAGRPIPSSASNSSPSLPGKLPYLIIAACLALASIVLVRRRGAKEPASRRK